MPTDDERQTVRLASTRAPGVRLLLAVAPSDGVCRVVAEHHERWDGRGYPAVGYEEAPAELERCAGTQFDPEVVLTFLCVSRPQLKEIIGPGAQA